MRLQKGKNLETVKILLNKGADINAAITDGKFGGKSFLILAVSKKKEYRNPELPEALLETKVVLMIKI